MTKTRIGVVRAFSSSGGYNGDPTVISQNGTVTTCLAGFTLVVEKIA